MILCEFLSSSLCTHFLLCHTLSIRLTAHRYAAWWAKTEAERKARPQDTTYLKNIAEFIGMEVDELAEHFCSEDALKRAAAYRAVGDYHGFENLDSYPLTMTRREVKSRYKELRFKTTAETM